RSCRRLRWTPFRDRLSAWRVADSSTGNLGDAHFGRHWTWRERRPVAESPSSAQFGEILLLLVFVALADSNAGLVTLLFVALVRARFMCRGCAGACRAIHALDRKS